MPRIFVALNFSVAVTRRIAEELERRKKPLADAGVRVAWVPAANLHVTLRFIGSVADELVEGITGALARVAQRHAPFDAKAAGLGAFPSLAKPNVLWIGVVAPQLAALQRDVEGALVELGLDPEERPFHPHVTVGRVKESRGDVTPLWTSDVDCGSSPLGEIIVYESKTRSSGAEYLARARVPLGRLQKEQG
jgi:2'-5' RNA ligase